MKLLRLLCLGLFAGQAKGVACPNQMVDAAVALRPSGYDEFLRRDAHYQESAELQR